MMNSKQAYDLALAYATLAVKLQAVENTTDLSLDNLSKAQYFSDYAMMQFLVEITSSETKMEDSLRKSVANGLADLSLVISENIKFFQAKKA